MDRSKTVELGVDDAGVGSGVTTVLVLTAVTVEEAALCVTVCTSQ